MKKYKIAKFLSATGLILCSTILAGFLGYNQALSNLYHSKRLESELIYQKIFKKPSKEELEAFEKEILSKRKKEPQIVPIQLPNWVEYSGLFPVNDLQANKLNRALRNFNDENKELQTRGFPLYFRSQHPNYSKHIQFSPSDSFELTFSAGSEFKVLDADARDGSAKVQLPKSSFEFFVQVRNNETSEGTLKLEDSLYYLQDHLSSTHRHTWTHLGVRPMPVPEAWQGEDRLSWTIKLSPKKLQHFVIYCSQTSQEASLPPGVREIGPEGGTVELPGVGKIEIPEGALDESIFVRLSQQRKAVLITAAFAPFSFTGKEIPPSMYDFASPMVKIEPLGTVLNKKGLITLHPRFRKAENLLRVMVWGALDDPFKDDYIVLPPQHAPRKGNDSPAEFEKFQYIVRLVEDIFDSNQEVMVR